MAVNLSRELINVLSGEPIKIEDDGEVKNLTIKDVLVRAAVDEADEKMRSRDASEKLRRWKLVNKLLQANEEIELSAKDVELLKRLVASSYTVVVYGQVLEELDPAENDE